MASIDYYLGTESSVGFFTDSSLSPGFVFSILARQGIPGAGYVLDSKSIEKIMVVTCLELFFYLYTSPLCRHQLVVCIRFQLVLAPLSPGLLIENHQSFGGQRSSE